ncbi:MAG: hypothetical protein A2086_01930 [Spirochaetes bacterium GWD1_27_9]|nr:MAG: hypothetical protein A2Z98_16705 [Spirochaetes bacterium GWB1_27_13]OHD41620.1 MAG: hypothetical protein A2086_01930 [Spirochaetes bacterium GWD1_27_9]
MDKNITKEFVFSLKIILIGIFFWVIKVKYFTFFWLPEFHLLNVFGFEIIGTILIIIGITIIHRVYPFAYSFFAIGLVYVILIINILDFVLFRFRIYRDIQQYTPFIMSIMLVLIAKLLESGLKYFGNKELSRKWKYLAIILFSGFSMPFYIYTSLNICGFITYEGFQITTKIILIFLPIILSLTFFFIFYLVILIQSFNFLAKVQKQNNEQIKI